MTDWSKRKRLEAAIAGERPDRPPVALWRHWPGDDQDAAALAAAHWQWQRDYDWDLVKVGPASSFSVAGWGLQDRWVGSIEGTREITYRPIQQVEDWQKLAVQDPSQGMLAVQIEALRLVGEKLGEETPYIATVFSPLAQIKYMAGDELLAVHMRQYPDLFREALAVVTESTIRYVEAARATGISGIYYAVQHARYPLMSRAEFAEFGRPYDLKVLAAASDLWLNVLHIHSTDIMFDLVADYPAQIVNWHDRDTAVSLADGLAQIQGAASGGVSQWTLHQESPEQTLAEIADALRQTDGRRLLLSTGCVAMATTPLRNLRAFREAVG